MGIGLIVFLLIAATLIISAAKGAKKIGNTEIGLVIKRFSFTKLKEGNPVAFKGEAGYQAELLMPGWRFKWWPIFSIEKHPWVSVPTGQIGVVISRVGQ